MPLSHSANEAMTQWCGNTPTLAAERAAARRLFFGDDDPRPVQYLPGGEEFISRERRFLGWFTFSHLLPSGERPSVVAARQMFRGGDLEPAVSSLQGVRYVTAIVRGVRVGSSFELELEEERFRVRFREMTYTLRKDDVLVCHLLPTRREQWLLTPGWLILPFQFGPGIRANLRDHQWEPIQMERFLQGRVDPEQLGPPLEIPRDATLDEAVARMTEAARAADIPGLILTPKEWQRLVRPLLPKNDSSSFVQEILDRVGEVATVEEANRWLGLAQNIWNNTPQPDRGGKSAKELVRERYGV